MLVYGESESREMKEAFMMAATLMVRLVAATASGVGPDVVISISQPIPHADETVALRAAAILARQITQRCGATVQQPPQLDLQLEAVRALLAAGD